MGLCVPMWLWQACLWEIASDGAYLRPCSHPEQPRPPLSRGGLAETLREDLRRQHPSPSQSPRQPHWVGRKLEPSEAPVGLTQLHTHYAASLL